MDHLLAVLFWGPVLLLAYSYLLYPAAMTMGLPRRTAREDERAPGSEGALPTVAVIVAAFNEEKDILARVENLATQDYPMDKLSILVGSDGSTDATVPLLNGVQDPRLKVHAFPVNRGKASVLNDLVASADADVLVFTDANTVFRKDTVRQLATAFDDRTAAVCGELVLRAADSGSNQDHEYWSIERRLKAAESSIGGLLGANGGVYAIRRERFRPLPPDTICDDFIIAMNIAAEGGGLRYVREAVAYEDTPTDVVAEFHRRSRIGIGNYQALFRYPRYLFGGSPVRTFTYFSHKVLRWLTPHLLLLALLASLLLADRPGYLLLALAQLAAYGGAALAFTLRHAVPWPRIVRSWMFFAVLNCAFLVGFSRFVTGNYRGGWRRTAR